VQALAFHDSTTNTVCERRVDLLVCSLPLHRHSYIGFILSFASSIHNKQLLDFASSIHYKQQLAERIRGLRPAPGESWSQICKLSLDKSAALHITLNLDGSTIISKSHTHPSHSQTSRLLTSFLSLGIVVPGSTQCIRDM
jgi:hypothetical protein